jgi:serine protease Do
MKKKLKYSLYGAILVALAIVAIFAVRGNLDSTFAKLFNGKSDVVVDGGQNQEKPTFNQDEVVKQANIGDNAQIYDKTFNLADGFANLVAYVTPSVVNISAIKIVKANPTASLPEEMDPAFKELLKNMMPQEEQQDQKMVGLGSGFIIRSDGFIATNNHVIAGAENIQITLSDGRKLSAEIHATDSASDIAVLKVNAKNLPSLKFGDSKKVRVGDWVITIGNPFGLGGTVSSGIVSALARDINIGTYNDFIQTDAAINRGNSGGPMINTQGEVIGINTAIFSTSGGGSIGIGFSVPADTVKNVVAQLIANKKVVRSYLGVQIQPIDENIAKTLSLPNTNGALVSNVVEDSPARVAGLKSGDVIISVNGEELKNSRILPKIISNIAPKTKVILGVISGGSKKEIAVILEEIPVNLNKQEEITQEGLKSNGKDLIKEITFHDIGIKITEINDSVRKYFKLPKESSGLIVLAVKNNSIAQQKGIVAGLKIVSLNQKVINNVEDFGKFVDSNKEKGLLFLLEDLKSGRYFVSITKKEIEQGYVD